MSTIHARHRRFGVVAFAIGLAGLLVFTLPSASASAAARADDVTSVQQLIADELAVHPGGTVVGNEIHYDNGVVFVAVPDGTFSLSQCTSGKFCGWSSAGYVGSFYWVGSSQGLSWTAGSYSNNRSGIARLYNSSGSASLCFTPGQDRSTVATSYYAPDRVTLTSGTAC